MRGREEKGQLFNQMKYGVKKKEENLQQRQQQQKKKKKRILG